ncbi:MAG: DUF262 domain-containing protein [Armatimonadetes bacterium]|nr:DUF262 domain-containing protein [Armatimonadota bacterium]
MQQFALGEEQMWGKPPLAVPHRLTDAEIADKYGRKAERIVTESNREQLPNFVAALKRTGYMNCRPNYQRRPRWDATRQSRLIESFIMNIPVPPLFVYETDFATYEVMDGQQRVSAVQAFYNNELVLADLERWPELNGRTYARLPARIRAALDRRSISYTVVLTESAASDEEAMLLKQLVFERLNTGGVLLGKQEVRNCLYQGPFNDLLLELARLPPFRAAWDLEEWSPEHGDPPPQSLVENRFWAQMEDAEVVLRFFALRHAARYQRGMQGFLDLYMARSRSFSGEDLALLRSVFARTVTLGARIYGDRLFRPWNAGRGLWEQHPHKAFGDAVLVGLADRLDDAEVLVGRQARVVEATRAMFEVNEPGTFTGRGNTKADVETRIKLFTSMLDEVLAE